MSGRTIVLGGLGMPVDRLSRGLYYPCGALLRAFDAVVLRVRGSVLGNFQGIPAVVELFLANSMMSGH